MKMQEMADQLVRVEKAYKDGGQEKGNADGYANDQGTGRQAKSTHGAPGKYDADAVDGQRLKTAMLLAHLWAKSPGDQGDRRTIEEFERIPGRGKAHRRLPISNNPDDARSYITTMKEEIGVLDTKVETLENMIETEKRGCPRQ